MTLLKKIAAASIGVWILFLAGCTPWYVSTRREPYAAQLWALEDALREHNFWQMVEATRLPPLPPLPPEQPFQPAPLPLTRPPRPLW